LYHPFLTPFVIMGLALTLREWRRIDSATLLLLLFGTSLPIVFTNNVHVGRLLLSLPALFLLAARGFSTVLGNLAEPRFDLGTVRPSAAWLTALGLLILAAYWGVVRHGAWWPTAPVAVLVLTALAVAVPIVLRRHGAIVIAASLALAILAVGAIQEYGVSVPKHYPYELAESLRQLPGDGPVVLVSRRTAGEMGDMEVASLAFYLRDQYAVSLGVPVDWNSPPGKRALYDVTGYAQNPARLPESLPDDALIVADREVGQQATERLQRQFGGRVLLAP